MFAKLYGGVIVSSVDGLDGVVVGLLLVGTDTCAVGVREVQGNTFEYKSSSTRRWME